MQDDQINEPRLCYLFMTHSYFLLGCTLDTGIQILGYFYTSTGVGLLVLFILTLTGSLDFLEEAEKLILIVSGIIWIIFLNTGVMAFLARMSERYCRLFLMNYRILWVIEFVLHLSYFIYMCGWYNPDLDELKLRNRPSIIALSALKGIIILTIQTYLLIIVWSYYMKRYWRHRVYLEYVNEDNNEKSFEEKGIQGVKGKISELQSNEEIRELNQMQI